MVSRAGLILAALLASFAAVQAQPASIITQHAQSAMAGRSISITANLSILGSTIPSNFIGISGEVGDFVNGFYQGNSGTWTSNGFTGNAASYVSLMSILGSNGVFRLGGGSSDVGTAPTITAGMATGLNTFVTALGGGWSTIYGLDLVANNSSAAASTASTLAGALGAANVVFQFGNEPSLNGINAATYVSRWNAYYSAVVSSVPTAKTGAVDDVFNPGWGDVPTQVALLTPGISGMTYITEHWYPFCAGQFATAVPAILLSQIQMQRFGTGGLAAGILGQYLVNTQAYGSTLLRMSETNSICARGQVGMSDRLVAATWFLNVAMVLASHGWSGINIHSVWTGGVGVYNPVLITPNHNFTATPIFHGMYLFSRLQGQQIITVAYSNAVSNVVAIATKGGGGNANILAVNNDAFNAVSVKPAQSAAWSTANVLMVQDSDGGGCGGAAVTIGGQPIGESGVWTGAPFTINNGDSVQIPPCGSALIQIQP